MRDIMRAASNIRESLRASMQHRARASCSARSGTGCIEWEDACSSSHAAAPALEGLHAGAEERASSEGREVQGSSGITCGEGVGSKGVSLGSGGGGDRRRQGRGVRVDGRAREAGQQGSSEGGGSQGSSGDQAVRVSGSSHDSKEEGGRGAGGVRPKGTGLVGNAVRQHEQRLQQQQQAGMHSCGSSTAAAGTMFALTHNSTRMQNHRHCRISKTRVRRCTCFCGTCERLHR